MNEPGPFCLSTGALIATRSFAGRVWGRLSRSTLLDVNLRPFASDGNFSYRFIIARLLFGPRE